MVTISIQTMYCEEADKAAQKQSFCKITKKTSTDSLTVYTDLCEVLESKGRI